MKLMWCACEGNNIFIFWRGKPIYKRWVNKDGTKTEASLLWNEQWPNERIRP